MSDSRLAKALRRPERARHALLATLAGAAFLSAGALAARGEEVIPIKLVGNLIIAECTLQTPAMGVQNCVLIDLGSKEGLQLHKSTAQALEIASANTQVEVLFGAPGTRASKVTVSKVLPVADEDQLSMLTRTYAEQLSEIPVGAVLGLGAFPDRILEVDLAAGVIRFISPPPDWTGFSVGEAFSYREVPAGLMLTHDTQEADHPKVAISTIRYEGMASPDAKARWKIGSSEAASLSVGAFDARQYTAFRIGNMPGTGNDQPDIQLGAQFASQFHIQINTAARRISLNPVGKPHPVPEEQAALIALSTGDVDGMEAFLKANQDSWLAAELGLEVLKRRTVDRNATPEQLTAAILFYVNGVKEDEKSVALLGYADALISFNDPSRNAAIKVTLDLAAEHSSKDLNNSAVHQINARRGLLEMRKGDLKAARRYLMSASFGLPRDPKINMMFGSLYRKLNQPARAWSKYIDATLVDDPPPAAFAALAELNDDLAFRANFGGGDAEMLLEGRAPSFSPSVPRSPEQKPAMRMVEFFSDTRSKTATGPQLAFNGLRDFFAGTPAVFVVYHLDDQLNNPVAQDRASAYAVRSPGTLLADGKVIGDKAGELEKAEALYEAYLPKLLQTDTSAPIEPSRIKLTAGTEGRLVKTTVSYTPAQMPADGHDLRLRVLLSEQRVFVPYGQVPIQYAVVRDEFTPAGGAKITGPVGPLDLSLNVDRLAVNFQLDPARLERQADRMDIREAQVIAFVEDAATHQILDAITVTPATRPAAVQTTTLEAKP